VLTRVISGPIAAAEGGLTSVTGSVLDATSPYYVAHAGPDLASAGPDLSITGSTVIGKVRARTLTLASDSIFHARLGDADPWQAPVWSSRRQAGCVRFCWLPADSITPRQYECLPPSQASGDTYAPLFVTTRYGRPSYCLLSGDGPVAVWTAADNVFLHPARARAHPRPPGGYGYRYWSGSGQPDGFTGIGAELI
jgi:hypothetical protein